MLIYYLLASNYAYVKIVEITQTIDNPLFEV